MGRITSRDRNLNSMNTCLVYAKILTKNFEFLQNHQVSRAQNKEQY